MISTMCVLNHIAVNVVVWAVLRQWNVVVQSKDLMSKALIQAASPNNQIPYNYSGMQWVSPVHMGTNWLKSTMMC